MGDRSPKAKDKAKKQEMAQKGKAQAVHDAKQTRQPPPPPRPPPVKSK